MLQPHKAHTESARWSGVGRQPHVAHIKIGYLYISNSCQPNGLCAGVCVRLYSRTKNVIYHFIFHTTHSPSKTSYKFNSKINTSTLRRPIHWNHENALPYGIHIYFFFNLDCVFVTTKKCERQMVILSFNCTANRYGAPKIIALWKWNTRRKCDSISKPIHISHSYAATVNTTCVLLIIIISYTLQATCHTNTWMLRASYSFFFPLSTSFSRTRSLSLCSFRSRRPLLFFFSSAN